MFIGPEGVETLDLEFLPIFCTNPVCRGMAGDLAGLFSQCPTSAQGAYGKLSRKANALKNSLKICGNVPGSVVSRQQLAVEGVIDPLSKQELLLTESWLYEVIRNATGIAQDRLAVLTQPVLHVNDFWIWSRIPMTPNAVAARSVVPLGGYRPVSLAGVEGRLSWSIGQYVVAAAGWGVAVHRTANVALSFGANYRLQFGELFRPAWSCWSA